MKKSRYRPESSLGPLATPEQMEIVAMAVRMKRVQVGRKALRYLTGVWYMTVDEFIAAVQCHLDDGGRIFRKYKQGANELLPDKLEASVGIREPNDDDDNDDGTVYVELIIRDHEMILIFDAHEHEEGIPRLPR